MHSKLRNAPKRFTSSSAANSVSVSFVSSIPRQLSCASAPRVRRHARSGQTVADVSSQATTYGGNSYRCRFDHPCGLRFSPCRATGKRDRVAIADADNPRSIPLIISVTIVSRTIKISRDVLGAYCAGASPDEADTSRRLVS